MPKSAQKRRRNSWEERIPGNFGSDLSQSKTSANQLQSERRQSSLPIRK